MWCEWEGVWRSWQREGGHHRAMQRHSNRCGWQPYPADSVKWTSPRTAIEILDFRADDLAQVLPACRRVPLVPLGGARLAHAAKPSPSCLSCLSCPRIATAWGTVTSSRLSVCFLMGE